MIPFLDLKQVTAAHSEEIQDAVRRVVDSGWYLQGEEVKMGSKVLKAAALTYVAAVAAALMQVFRLVLFFMINNRDDD